MAMAITDHDNEPVENTNPIKDRSCTDIPCLLIFICIIICWIGVAIYAFNHGDLKKISTPRDSHGYQCGVDEEVKNKPYLMIFDLSKCSSGTCRTPQVCQEKCPNTSWYSWDFDVSKNSPNSISNQKKYFICENHINLTNKDDQTLFQYLKAGVCAKWYVSSIPRFFRCIPVNIPIREDIKNKTETAIIKGTDFLNSLLRVESIKEKIQRSWVLILLFILGSMIVCLMYIGLLRWFALPCVLIALTGLIGTLIYLAYLCYIKYQSTGTGMGWLVSTIVLSVLAVIVVLITLCLMQRIRIACKLIGEAGKAIIQTVPSLIFPIVPWLLHLALIAFTVYVGLLLVSMRILEYRIVENLNNGNCSCLSEVNLTNNAMCTPREFFDNCKENGEYCFSISCNLYTHISNSSLRSMYLIHLIGFIWTYLFITAFCELALAGTFASWYWADKKSEIPFMMIASTWRTIRYHLGTAAFGAFLITLCKLLKLFLKCLYTQASTHSPKCKESCKAFYGVGMCCVSILEKFIKFINRNAYIMCAVKGKGLCVSAASAFTILTNNILRTIVLNNIIDLLIFFGKIVVVSITMAFTWWYSSIEKYQIDSIDEDMWWVPVALVGLGSYLVSNIFFIVLSTAVDTIFLCFLKDIEMNNGSWRYQYRMNKSLRELLK